MDVASLETLLASRGFLAAEDEARQLVERAGADPDLLASLVVRRLEGEPLAWITGRVRFCGLDVRVDSGVYVPRWHTQELARRAVARLPAGGTAIDVCTGSGAVARVLGEARPDARVVACDIDAAAVACAAANGVDAHRGDLFDALPACLAGCADVVVAVVPYVPTPELPFLQRDTFAFETALAYDGGRDGTEVLRRVIRGAPRFLRPGGALLFELGGDQAAAVTASLDAAGFVEVRRIVDEDRDERGLEATLGADPGARRPAPP
ncbi:MAG TPA: methyltransferase [Candidatus Dormibacteraeota bacterium]|nr:methyltransferase [Candidatus Dormibacteraeota bacterium]